MAAQRAAADPFDKTDVYNKQIKQLADIRQLYKETAMASGDWHVQTVKTVSASQRLTESIQKQKVTVAQAAKEYVNYRKGQQGALSEAIKEQTALRHAMLGQMTAHTFGKNEVDLITPKQITPELERARVKYGMINELIGAAAHNTVNWGKNTQWAGRQITVGMTMPLAMAAAAGAALAFQVDKELTNIARVYDTVATTAAGKEAELMQLRETSLNAATQMTKEYAVAAKDVLGIQSQLAATGLNGTELQQYTQETMRVATLGDFDPAVAAEMTISLSTAFKDQIKTVDDLKETYDFYNIVAQETSLQMEDIAAAIPRAASAMSALGVSTKEMGVLMVALRESGVDPEVGANALKSATSTLLDPTQEAIDYWSDTLHKDLPAIVKDAGGNLFKFLQTVGKELNGLDPQVVQTAVTKTFGKYQFDRATALVTNFGDAMTGVGNQTKTAMDLIDESATSMAEKSAAELATLQESISFRFKAAFESVKNALIPLGMATLNVLTPALEFVTKLIDAFNGLPAPFKNFLIVLAVGAALVGPLLMLIGIFANLMGNVVKFGANMRNLVIRFKAVDAAEAAATIQAKNASSAFDNEARSTALLTQKVQALTAAFEQNAVARGLMPGPDGTIGSVGKDGARNTRKVTTDKDGNYRYEKGSRSQDGTPLGGQRIGVNHPDVLAYQQSQTASAAIADNAGKTDKRFKNVGRTMGGIAGVGTMAFATMASSSAGINDKWINIAMVAGSAFMMFPNMLSGLGTGLTKILDKVKAIGPAMAKSTGAGGFRKNMSLMVNSARPLDTLKTIAPQFTRIAGTALRVFGPVGILAGGALILKDIVGDMHQVAADSRAMAGTAESWANAIGYSYVPGQMPGMNEDDVSSSQKAATLADEMAKSVDGLGDAFGRISSKSDAFDRAMQQALKVLTTGGSVEQARQTFEASLSMMNISAVEMDELLLKFDRVSLDNPQAVRNAIKNAIQDVMDEDLELDIPITPGEDAEGIGENIGAWFEERFGGDLSGAAEAMGQDLGDQLATGLASAGSNKHIKVDFFKDAIAEANQIFEDEFNEIANNEKATEVFKELGIKGMDDLYAAMKERSQMRRDGKELTGAWADFNALIIDEDLGDAFTEIDGQYEQFLDNFVDGMGLSEGKAEALREAINSILDVQEQVVGNGIGGTVEAEAARKDWEYTTAELKRHGVEVSDASALATLNVYRLKAGMSAATNVAQGFGGAGEETAEDLKEVAEAAQDAADGIMRFNEENVGDLVNAQKSSMQGAWGDIIGEAGRLYDDQRQGVIDGLQAQQDATDAAYDREEKSQDAHFDSLEKNADNYWKARTKSAEDSWDAQEEAAEDASDAEDKSFDDRIESLRRLADAEKEAFDGRIKAVQDTIEAEQKAEEQRQRIFEAEQTRIDRMADRLNSNIDFNVALNSGDLDQAARISNDISSREQTWMNEDARDSLSLASEERVTALEQQIEGLESQRDQRVKDLEQQQEALKLEQEARRLWHQERLEQIRESRDVAMEALKAEEEANRENLRIQRQIAEESLTARRDSDRKSMEAHIKAEQDKTEADKRELASRLRELQEFIPTNEQELRDHVGRIEALYGEYGLVLQGHGTEWSGIIGTALDRNVAIAATNLQTSINWKGIAERIAGEIGAGLGMTMGQVTEFLRTGNLPPPPPGSPLIPGPTGGQMSMAQVNQRDYRAAPARHTGGEIGGGHSQKDRTGVPRGASPYPSEELIIAKKGEFMVNAKAYRQNKGLVQAINSGGNPGDVGGPIGGLADYATSLTSMHMLSALKVAQYAATNKLTQAIAARDAAAAAAANFGGGSTGTIAGGNAPWERLWNTIRGRFPQAGLNDSTRPGANDYHGRGMAVDLGLRGTPGGNGNMFMAEMNRWIYDNFRGSTELIYNGLGDDRPNLKNGMDYAYNAATQAGHRNHVHWAMTPEAIAAAGLKIASGGASAPAAGGGDVRGQVMAAANQRGWGSGANWSAIDWIIGKESSWNPNAQNPVSTASGLFQHIDSTWNAYKRPGVAAAKMRLAPVNEQAWAGMNYMAGRYGTPAQAQAFWQAKGWYDDGGYLQPGATMAMNGTRTPEPVFTGPQWDILKANIGNATYNVPGSRNAIMPVKIVDNVANGENNQYNVTVDLRGAYIKEEIDIQTAVEKAIDVREARNGRKRVIGSGR